MNAPLTLSHFPDEWKEAIVKPIMKKGTKDLFNYKNLRPISNLQFLSKITERAVFDQIYSHINSNNLFPALQSAYRKFHSTETALLHVTNDILLSTNKQHVSLLVMLDLSAAFDIVDHSALLHRLETTYGITRYAMKPDGLSEKQHLPFRLPQGSCLGVLLFSIYAGKLFNIIQNYLPHAHAYADDTKLYLSFRPDGSTNETEAWNAMERCVRAV